MPPKEVASKKTATNTSRPPISDSSLLNVPEDAEPGYQERIEKGIDWTLLENAGQHHKKQCLRTETTKTLFSEAFQNKIKKSLLNGFLNGDANLSLREQWDCLLPLVLWDNEKFANDEGKICFNSNNCITNDILKLIKKAVHADSRKVLWNDLLNVSVLRVINSEITTLDESLAKFKNLVSLNLSGNYLKDINTNLIPRGVRILELQANNISMVDNFDNLSNELMYLGLARNFISNESLAGFYRLPRCISVLDLADNDIYHLEPVLDALVELPSLKSLQLAGNPCSVCAAYARTTLTRLPNLQWLDSRDVLATDRNTDPFEPHANDLRSSFFTFNVLRIISAPQPPKPEKGALTTFHVEIELPLLDSTRRQFLMFRRNESLTEILPPAEDDEWSEAKPQSPTVNSKCTITNVEASSHEPDIYDNLVAVNSREIRHYTIFETNKVQWSKVINFQEPSIKLFCPDLNALRNTFRSVITIRLIYSVTATGKSTKADKKSVHTFKMPSEQRVTLATIKCGLKRNDWTQQYQHFHWDDSLGTEEAIHWGDGDLSVIQYVQAASKPAVKGKLESESGKQTLPENLTCHFSFGIYSLR